MSKKVISIISVICLLMSLITVLPTATQDASTKITGEVIFEARNQGRVINETTGFAEDLINNFNRYIPERVFDGNTDTYTESYYNSDAAPWVGYKLSSAYKITKIRFYPRAAYPQRMTGGKFQGANNSDFRNAVDLHTIGSTPSVSWIDVNVTASGSFYYLRYLSPTDTPSPGGFCNVAEIEFYGTIDEAAPTPEPPSSPSPTPTSDPPEMPKLPNIYADNMVLQANQPVKVYGFVASGSNVTATLSGGGNTYSASAVAAGGKFTVVINDLIPPSYTAYSLTVKSGGYTKTLSNVVFGDVYLLTGQSNMEIHFNDLLGSDHSIDRTLLQADMANANEPYIRSIKVSRVSSNTPTDDIGSTTTGSYDYYSWRGTTTSNISSMSVLSYYFAKNIKDKYNYPVGVLNAAWGGTSIGYFVNNGAIYNNHIYPFRHFAIKGILWYQGESDDGYGSEVENYYRPKQIDLINDYRALFGANTPFVMTQLANYTGSSYRNWRNIRQAQLDAFKYFDEQPSNTVGLISTIDQPFNDGTEIHPGGKKDIARQYFLWAESVIYGKGGEYAGPVLKSAKKENGGLTLTFDHVGFGLAVRGGGTEVMDIRIHDDDFGFTTVSGVISGTNTIRINNYGDPALEVSYAYRECAHDALLINKDGFSAPAAAPIAVEGVPQLSPTPKPTALPNGMHVSSNTLTSKLGGYVIGTTQNVGSTTKRECAFDGNMESYSQSTYSDLWVGLNLDTASKVAKIRFAPRAGWAIRMNGGKFQGSNTADFSGGVVDLYTISSTPNEGWNEVAVGNTAEFKYVRYWSTISNYLNVAEVEFYSENKTVQSDIVIADGVVTSVIIASKPISGFVVVGAYDGGGKLLGCKSVKMSQFAFSGNAADIAVNMPIPSGTVKVKAMIIRYFDNIRPLTQAMVKDVVK